jgi:E3 ubiquitin-protein ligase UBR7
MVALYHVTPVRRDVPLAHVIYAPLMSHLPEHKLVELWTKRSFRCDCPTHPVATSDAEDIIRSESKMEAATSSGSSRRRRCNLHPADQQPQSANENNVYSKNFKGEFCRCGRAYDPETEEEAMLNCIACEVGDGKSSVEMGWTRSADA